MSYSNKDLFTTYYFDINMFENNNNVFELTIDKKFHNYTISRE